MYNHHHHYRKDMDAVHQRAVITGPAAHRPASTHEINDRRY